MSALPPATAPIGRDPIPDGALDERLAAQLGFLVEVGRATQVIRRNRTADGSRRETVAEHQWHVALMALVLAEHAAEPVDPVRVATMLLLHDVVEIDAGDVYLYDTAAREAVAGAEAAAAERIFGLLPADQAEQYRRLWEELEAGDSADARFARSLDRLAPLLLNAASGGAAWREHGISATRVGDVVLGPIAAGSAALHAAAQAVIGAAVDEGILDP